jgi:hypothetical protein
VCVLRFDAKEEAMDATYYVAGIDVHKKMLAAVAAKSETENYGSRAGVSVP